jgi:hypothetical protein
VGIKPHWILFRKFFRVKLQPSTNDSRVVEGAGIQMREDAADQYLAYKLIDSNQDWKAKWSYITNHHLGLPKPSGKQLKHRPWWNTEPMMQEGIQLPELLQKIEALREAGLRAEHVAFNFMKRRVQPLMARETLGYQYTGNEDTSRMLGNEVDDKDIVERLGRIVKDMHHTLLAQSPSTPRLVRRTRYIVEISALSTYWSGVVILTQIVCCRMTSRSLSLIQLPLLNL